MQLRISRKSSIVRINEVGLALFFVIIPWTGVWKMG